MYLMYRCEIHIFNIIYLFNVSIKLIFQFYSLLIHSFLGKFAPIFILLNLFTFLCFFIDINHMLL